MKEFFKSEPVIYGNYSGAGNFPEGSIDALRECFELGADAVTLNVQLTADGVLVAVPQEDLSQLCEASGRVSDYTFEKLRGYDAAYTFANGNGEFSMRGKGYVFPSLKEILVTFPEKKFNVNLLLKDIKLAEAYSEFLHEGDYKSRVFTSSMYASNLRIVRKAHADAVTSMSFWEFIRVYALFRLNMLGFKKKFNADIYQVPENIGLSNFADEELLNILHRSGVRVYVWNVSDEQSISRLREAGVDAIMSSRVQSAVHVPG